MSDDESLLQDAATRGFLRQERARRIRLLGTPRARQWETLLDGATDPDGKVFRTRVAQLMEQAYIAGQANPAGMTYTRKQIVDGGGFRSGTRFVDIGPA